MNGKAPLHIAAAWLASALALAAIVRQIGLQDLDVEVSRFLTSYFLITLEEPMFSDGAGAVNDRDSIANAGRKINEAIGTMIEPSWFSTLQSCGVAVRKIDGIEIDAGFKPQRELILAIPRNRIARSVEVGLACESRIAPHAAWTVLLGIGFLFLYTRTAYPLSGSRLRWLRELVAQGYDSEEAYRLCSSLAEAGRSPSGPQRSCFEALHDPPARNYARALRLAGDPRVAELSGRQVEWLVWRLRNDPGDFEGALRTARAQDSVEIDLSRGTLTIHGTAIPVNKTPLFYYAWYANGRRLGDGWLANPQSNKPDRLAGERLARLMRTCAGHAKAAASLERIGLKAKTLDQNRSKIKQEIVAVLGDELSAPYLFDERKDPKTGRTSYRLRVSPERVTILPS